MQNKKYECQFLNFALLKQLLTTHRVSCLYMSLVMSKPAFCICENKDADQLRGNREADQRLCFRYTDSTILYFLNFKHLDILCNCTVRFVLDQVRNPEDRFSHNEADMWVKVYYTEQRKTVTCSCNESLKLY